MQLPEGVLQKIKTGLYSLIAICVFLGWALTIAVFTKDGPVGGATRYYFFMTWISIPAFIYLAATPLFPRAQRFANPYWFAIVDVLYTILWLAAFAAVAAWTNSGIKDTTKGCAEFAFGDSSKCSVSRATVGLGVAIWALWVALSGISVYTLLHYRKTGDLYYIKAQISKPTLESDSMNFNYRSPEPGTDEEAQNLNQQHTGIEQNDDHSDHSGDHDHLEMPSIPTSTLSPDHVEPHPPYSHTWGGAQRQQPIPLSAPPTYSRAQSPSYGQPAPNTFTIPPSLQTGAGRISPPTAPYTSELPAYDRRTVTRDYLPPNTRAGGGYDTGYYGGHGDLGQGHGWRDETGENGVGGVPYPTSDYGH